MNVVAWILQIVAALAFFAAGAMKLARPKPALVGSGPGMAWAEDFSAPNIKLIGAVEILGALGLILPWVLNIAPILTPLAGIGLTLLMGGAVVTHVQRKEQFVPPLVLGVLALVVAILRFAS